jgi:hypothetical protein
MRILMPNYYARASAAEMLGIPYVLVGDQCLRTDLNQVFVCTAAPSSALANWSPTTGSSGGVPVQQGLLANLPSRLPVGTIYFATDVNILYVGTVDGNAPTTALPLFGLQEDIPQDLPIGILYFATDTNVLFVSTGPGNVVVVPAMQTGTLAQIPALPTGIFYLTTDTNSLYVGTAGGNLLVGPRTGATGPQGPQGIPGANMATTYLSVPVSNPAVGQGVKITVPDGVQWKIYGCNFSMVTGATAGNRIAKVFAQDASSRNLVECFSAYNQPAGETAVYNFAPGVNSLSATVDYVYLTEPMPLFVLGSGFTFQITFIGITATDQISGITLMVEESTPGLG